MSSGRRVVGYIATTCLVAPYKNPYLLTYLLTYMQTVMEKQNLELKARVKGDPEPTVTWYRDDKQLAATLKVAIDKSKDELTVKIQQVTSAAAGTYKCVATNKHGSAEHAAVVTVTGP